MSNSFTYFPEISAQLPEIPADSIVSRTILDDDFKVVLFGFAPGQELSEHTSARPAILHFLSGEADLMLGAEPRQAEPGTWVHMPPNLPHSVHAHTTVAMLLILL